MIIADTFYNIKCDCCGAIADKETWSPDIATAEYVAQESEFKHLDDKDYCPNCYHYDDNDRIVLKDGRVFDEVTEEIIDK